MSNRRVGVWRWSVACALSIMCSLGLAAPVVAQDEQSVMPPPPRYYEDVDGHGELPNMFETNVPYVAWRGEQIRAVKCDRDYAGVREADVIVGDWSGDGNFKPELESTQFEAFESSKGKPCVAFNMLAHRPGMAFVVLTPKDPKPDDYYVPAKHTFLMIWMSIDDVSIDEVGANDPTGDAPEGSNAEVGDPLGDGIFDAGDPYGRVAVKVKGTFPAFDGGPAWTLPNDWASLAVYATDPNLGNYRDPMRWDIHDDTTDVIGHKWPHGFCYPPVADPPAPHTDSVDNCNGGGDLGHFSTVFGTGNLAAGPFDPARPATLLSNGQLNSGDAPMPALRVNVKIKPNSGEDGDLSGVGQLLKSDKSDVYSHDGSGADKTGRHNLYAPYYKQFIPATYPIRYKIPEASGIDGPCAINDNVGFAWPCGLYDNWDTYETKWAKDGPTQCNKYVDWEWSIGKDGGYPNGTADFNGGGGGHYDRPDDSPRRNPYGPQSVWVYTDEHGEAQVRYDPYAGGFFYDNLIGDGPGQAILNDNRGCDLQDVDLLGTSQISASADYPYLQVGPNVPVDAAPASLTKQVFNEFDKSMYYYPKGTGAANQNARIVVVHANDVNGEPFAGEKVCFYLDDEADGVRGFAGTTGVANGEPELSMEELGRRPHHGKPLPEGRFRVEGGYAHKVAGDICRTLDRNGNAAIEVFNSDPQDINVIAEFLEEGLLRDIDVDFRVAGSSSEDPGPPPSGNDDNNDCRRSHNGCPRSNDGTTPPSAAQILATAGPQAAAKLAPSIKKAKPSARRITVRRVTLRKGKYALTIRVNSPRKSETVRIRVGKRSIKRRVATNRLVTLKGLPISKGVNVSVSLSS